MKKITSAMIAAVMLIMALASVSVQAASWPATNGIQTYVLSTKNDTVVYETASSKSKYGTIYATDLITIKGYSGSRLKVTYPTSNGSKTGYIESSKVTSAKINSAISTYTATSKTTTYRRASTSATLGSISKGDKVYIIVDNSNGWQQVIYPISGGYKMGWINTGNTGGTSSGDYDSKVKAFMADSRWKVGTSWGANHQTELSSNKNCWGCCAYAWDFAQYVYNKKVTAGTKFSNASEIRSGDILYVTPQHWMIVLYRNGNNLDVLHGNWTNGKVCRSNFTLNGKTIGSKTFSYGYHMQ
jgi:hypothetical protein